MLVKVAQLLYKYVFSYHKFLDSIARIKIRISLLNSRENLFKLKFSTANHPSTGSQPEFMNGILEYHFLSARRLGITSSYKQIRI